MATPRRKGRGRVEDGRLTVRGGARASIVVMEVRVSNTTGVKRTRDMHTYKLASGNHPEQGRRVMKESALAKFRGTGMGERI
jgi:hypothetical protein